MHRNVLNSSFGGWKTSYRRAYKKYFCKYVIIIIINYRIWRWQVSTTTIQTRKIENYTNLLRIAKSSLRKIRKLIFIGFLWENMLRYLQLRDKNDMKKLNGILDYIYIIFFWWMKIISNIWCWKFFWYIL